MNKEQTERQTERAIKNDLIRLQVKMSADMKAACLRYANRNGKELKAYLQGLAHAGAIAESDRSLLLIYYMTKAERLSS